MEFWIKYAKILPNWEIGIKTHGVRHSEPDLKYFKNEEDMYDFLSKIANGFIILDRSERA